MSTQKTNGAGPKLWVLRFVLPGRYGRWITGLLLFVFGVAVYRFGGIFGTTAEEIPSELKSVALFFCVVVAYLVPTFHYVSERSEIAIDSLEAEIDPDQRLLLVGGTSLRDQISHRSLSWQVFNLFIGTMFWLVQSWFLAGGFAGMLNSLTGSVTAALMAVGALPVWLTFSLAIHAMINNAQLFRRLARVVKVDVLHTDSLMAFGRMAVSAVLVVVGAQASFSIMFFGGVDTPWAWGPGLVLTTIAMGYLLFGPVMPLRDRLRSGKALALADVDSALRSTSGLGQLADHTNRRQVSELLAIRQQLRAVPEWPFDMDLLARLGIYLIIVPLTWVGAALIENVVDLVLT